MAFATHYSHKAGWDGSPLISLARKGLAFSLCALAWIAISVHAKASTNGLSELAETEFQNRLLLYQANPTNAEAVWQFARASFLRAEFSTNNTQRAALAKPAIKACRDLLAREPDSAEAHYYLGMNLGQLARTKTLGALPIVDEMETEFKAALAINELLEFAGPDRYLGTLYLEAPSFGSIGDRKKADTHLRRALKLAPAYPENRLNLVEACMSWGELKNARRELALLEDELEQARKTYSGEQWAAAWADWERRLQIVRSKLKPSSKPAKSPKALPH